MPAGRPSVYDPARIDEVREACERGATDVEVADLLGVNVATVYRWKNLHPEFCEALKVGKDVADDGVEASLYRRARGYSHQAVKIMAVDGVVHREEYTEHHPPDTTAAIFWLKNRRSKDWRDKTDLNLNLDDDTTNRLARALAKAREGA